MCVGWGRVAGACLVLVSLCTHRGSPFFTGSLLVHREFTEWVSPGFLACFDHSSPLTPVYPPSPGLVPFSTSLLLSVVLILAAVEEKRKPGHFAIQVNL